MVAIAKSEAYNQLYEKLDAKGGQGNMSKLVKRRNKSTKDITHIRQIKDKNGNILGNETDIIRRWKQYFENLLNEENERFVRGDGEPNNSEVIGVTRQEVEMALRKTKNGKADEIPVEAWKALGEEGGSALSPLLFNIFFDVITENVRDEPPRRVFHGDDIVLVAENKEMLKRKLEEWRYVLESKRTRIRRTKTEYLSTEIDGDQHATIQLNGVNLKRIKTFKYLGSMVDQTQGMEKEVNFRIQCGWNNWSKISGAICDRRVPVKVKSKVHKALVRPALIYGLAAAPLKKIEERKFDVAEMKMLKWMSGVTRRDRIRNE
ncbi:uncharacterized protein LOC122264575 [Penaeus japonicus]|uniref:uncharacterized protein LOC122264575 n=1 Tax=Penaeus japonicus TaxID=27405 RepID=UPI001C711F52|nr:uncharacterized protein LOC122264575 [Penaeus japonicus]